MCNAISKLQYQLLRKMAVYVVSHCTADKKEDCHILNNVCSWHCLVSLLFHEGAESGKDFFLIWKLKSRVT